MSKYINVLYLLRVVDDVRTLDWDIDQALIDFVYSFNSSWQEYFAARCLPADE